MFLFMVTINQKCMTSIPPIMNHRKEYFYFGANNLNMATVWMRLLSFPEEGDAEFETTPLGCAFL